MDLLRDQYEAAVLDSWIEPDVPADDDPAPDSDDVEHTWYSTSRIGYDADTFALIQGSEPEGHWFG